MNGQIDCTFFRENLNAYLDSALDIETRKRMDAHAGRCPECAERLETMTRLLTMCAEMDEGLTIPLDAQAAWRKAIREEAAHGAAAAKSRAPKAQRGRGWGRALGTVAAALVLIVGGTFAYRMNEAAPDYSSKVTYGAMTSNELGGYYTGANQDTAGAQGARALRLEADGALDGDMLGSQPDIVEEAANTDGDLAQKSAVVIRSAERTIETAGFDQSLKSVRDLVEEYEGWLENYSESAADLNGNSHTANFVARVAAERLDDFLLSLDAVGTVTNKSESAEDISDRYYDLQSRLVTYRTQLARLNELMQTASGLEDMLMLEDKLAQVQQQIDSMEGQAKAWDSRAGYATVYVTLNEQGAPVADPGDLGDRVKKAFEDSLVWFKAFVQDAAVVLAMAGPVLIVAIPAIVVICLIVSAIRRAKRRREK